MPEMEPDVQSLGFAALQDHLSQLGDVALRTLNSQIRKELARRGKKMYNANLVTHKMNPAEEARIEVCVCDVQLTMAKFRRTQAGIALTTVQNRNHLYYIRHNICKVIANRLLEFSKFFNTEADSG